MPNRRSSHSAWVAAAGLRVRCDARIHGRRCRRVAVGKAYESKLAASKPGWSLVTKHRFCARCGDIFLRVTRHIETVLRSPR